MPVAPTQSWESEMSPHIVRCTQGLGTKSFPVENHWLRSFLTNGDEALTSFQGWSLSVPLEWLGKHTMARGVGGDWGSTLLSHCDDCHLQNNGRFYRLKPQSQSDRQSFNADFQCFLQEQIQIIGPNSEMMEVRLKAAVYFVRTSSTTWHIKGECS